MRESCDTGRPTEGCLYFVKFVRLSTTERWTVSDMCDVHTCGTGDNERGVKRSLSVSKSTVARVVSRTAGAAGHNAGRLMGNGRAAVKNALNGLTASDDMIARSLALHRRPSPAQQLGANESNSFAALQRDFAHLCAYATQWQRLDNQRSTADVAFFARADGRREFKHAIFFVGDVADMYDAGVLAPVFGLDFTHVPTLTVTVRDVLNLQQERYGVDGGGGAGDADVDQGDTDSADVGARARRRGRPALTGGNLCHIGVVTVRSYARTKLPVAFMVCGGETRENAETLVRAVNEGLGLSRKHDSDGVTSAWVIDKGRAINGAVKRILQEAANIVNCNQHLQRNIVSRCRGDSEQKFKVLDVFKKLSNASTVDRFNRFLATMKDLDEAMFARLDSSDKTTWAKAFLPMNILDNLTANDAEGMFSNLDSAQGVSNKVRALISSAATAHGATLEQVRKSEADPIPTSKLQRIVRARLQGARIRWVVSSRPDPGRCLSLRSSETVARTDAQAEEVVVDLRDLNNRRSWCSAGCCIQDVLPCEHVLHAVRNLTASDQLLHGDLAPLLFPGGTRAQMREHMKAISLPHPELEVESFLDVLPPRYIAVRLSRRLLCEEVSATASRVVGGRPILSSTASVGRGAGSRVRSVGEQDAADSSLAASDVVMVQLGTLRRDAPIADRGLQGDDAEEFQRRYACTVCGLQGHNSRTCQARGPLDDDIADSNDKDDEDEGDDDVDQEEVEDDNDDTADSDDKDDDDDDDVDQEVEDDNEGPRPRRRRRKRACMADFIY